MPNTNTTPPTAAELERRQVVNDLADELHKLLDLLKPGTSYAARNQEATNAKAPLAVRYAFENPDDFKQTDPAMQSRLRRIQERSEQIKAYALERGEGFTQMAMRLLDQCAGQTALSALAPLRDAPRGLSVQRLSRTLSGVVSLIERKLPVELQRTPATFTVVWPSDDLRAARGSWDVEGESASLPLWDAVQLAAHLFGEMPPDTAHEVTRCVLTTLRQGELTLPGFDRSESPTDRRRSVFTRRPTVMPDNLKQVVLPAIEHAPEVASESEFVLFNQRPILASILDVFRRKEVLHVEDERLDFLKVIHEIAKKFELHPRQVLWEFSSIVSAQVNRLQQGADATAVFGARMIDRLLGEVERTAAPALQ